MMGPQDEEDGRELENRHILYASSCMSEDLIEYDPDDREVFYPDDGSALPSRRFYGTADEDDEGASDEDGP